MGYQLSKVIQYFFSILFPILAYIIGGLANLEFSYHYYIQFNSLSSLLINTFPCASLGDVEFHGMQDPPFWGHYNPPPV